MGTTDFPTTSAAASPDDARANPPPSAATDGARGTFAAGTATDVVGPPTLRGELLALSSRQSAALNAARDRGDSMAIAWHEGVIGGIDASMSFVSVLLRRLEEDRDRLRRIDCPDEAAGLNLAIRLIGGAR